VTSRTILRPSTDHPITIAPETRRVRVRAAGASIADSGSALALAEAAYAVVFYVPRADADMSRLERSGHTSWCPYKGVAHYFHVTGPHGVRIENAAWTYEAPPPDTAAIKDHLAFYPSKVEIEVE
jgi:uncharacterized protein (DUF427 family)